MMSSGQDDLHVGTIKGLLGRPVNGAILVRSSLIYCKRIEIELSSGL